MMISSIDPIADFALRGGLALILVIAAMHKLNERATFESQLGAYDLLPDVMVHAASRAIPLCELAIALCLLVRSENSAYLGAGLFAIYAGAIGINLLRGRRDIDCGCGTTDGHQSLHPALVVRNLLLAIGAGLILLPQTPRPTFFSDYAIAAFAGLAGVALYLAANVLIAQLPASGRLKV
ncbi:MAG: MauE/DoxX family redox-associated membrane protein [Parvibaculum sp.]|nr:MauE/DoxX family redox-associated membrane protein [Parvibaculum sp.]